MGTDTGAVATVICKHTLIDISIRTTRDMQGLVWDEPELAHEYNFDVENIIAGYATWRNATS